MMALHYEILLRGIYQCDRNYKNGADASIYRIMEQARVALETKSMFKTQEARELNFRVKFATVREYVANAITELLHQLQPTAGQEIVKRLTKMKEELTPTFFDKDKLDEIIRDACTILAGKITDTGGLS